MNKSNIVRPEINIMVIKNIKYFILNILYICFFIYFTSCKSNKSKLEGIEGKEVISSDSLGYVRDLVINNDLLILLDEKPLNNDEQLRIYDLNNFNYLYSIGRLGSGPGEFLQGMSLNKITYGTGGFSLLDLSSKKVLVYKPDSSGKLTYYINISLKEGRPYMPLLLNDSTIYSLGLELFSERFAKYDYMGNMITTLGELPPGKEKDIPMPVHHQACKGVMRITPDGEKIVISYQFADLIDIYNKEGKLLKRISGKKNKPIYKLLVRSGYPTFVITDKTILGYLDIEVTNKYIVALYSGEYATNTQYESNKIKIYTLDGKFIKTIILNTKVSQIEVDLKHNKLLGVHYFPHSKVYSFDLQKVLN